MPWTSVCARYCARCWGYRVRQADPDSAVTELNIGVYK